MAYWVLASPVLAEKETQGMVRFKVELLGLNWQERPDAPGLFEKYFDMPVSARDALAAAHTNLNQAARQANLAGLRAVVHAGSERPMMLVTTGKGG